MDITTIHTPGIISQSVAYDPINNAFVFGGNKLYTQGAAYPTILTTPTTQPCTSAPSNLRFVYNEKNYSKISISLNGTPPNQASESCPRFHRRQTRKYLCAPTMASLLASTNGKSFALSAAHASVNALSRIRNLPSGKRQRGNGIFQDHDSKSSDCDP